MILTILVLIFQGHLQKNLEIGGLQAENNHGGCSPRHLDIYKKTGP